MGGVVSAGHTNDELIDKLKEAKYIKSPEVEKVFRLVDRGNYLTEESQNQAYRDNAWKSGDLHMSAPCIYAQVMEGLDVRTGMSFLNIGSGTGYLSTMVGLILGPFGINHGVELHGSVVYYARERLSWFLSNSSAIDIKHFSEPQFCQGNGLCIQEDGNQYDRVYVGASCPESHENFIKSLIKVNGILVMPRNDKLVKITRTGESDWAWETLIPVSFASLIIPDPKSPLETVFLPAFRVPLLQEIARELIRSTFRTIIERQNGDLCTSLIHDVALPVKRKEEKFNLSNMTSSSLLSISDLESDSDCSEGGSVLYVSRRLHANQLSDFLQVASRFIMNCSNNSEYDGQPESDEVHSDHDESLNDVEPRSNDSEDAEVNYSGEEDYFGKLISSSDVENDSDDCSRQNCDREQVQYNVDDDKDGDVRMNSVNDKISNSIKNQDYAENQSEELQSSTEPVAITGNEILAQLIDSSIIEPQLSNPPQDVSNGHSPRRGILNENTSEANVMCVNEVVTAVEVPHSLDGKEYKGAKEFNEVNVEGDFMNKGNECYNKEKRLPVISVYTNDLVNPSSSNQMFCEPSSSTNKRNNSRSTQSQSSKYDNEEMDVNGFSCVEDLSDSFVKEDRGSVKQKDEICTKSEIKKLPGHSSNRGKLDSGIVDDLDTEMDIDEYVTSYSSSSSLVASDLSSKEEQEEVNSPYIPRSNQRNQRNKNRRCISSRISRKDTASRRKFTRRVEEARKKKRSSEKETNSFVDSKVVMDKYSALLLSRIKDLPLPSSLKLFLNYNRQL